MRKVNYLSGSAVAAVLSALSAVAAHAASGTTPSISVSTLSVTSAIGPIGSLGQGVVFILNLFVYLGWIGVIVGVGLAVFGLVYKLINTDSEEAMKTVQGYLTKAVLIVVAGILLIGSGFIIKTVASFFGASVNPLDTVTQDQTVSIK